MPLLWRPDRQPVTRARSSSVSISGEMPLLWRHKAQASITRPMQISISGEMPLLWRRSIFLYSLAHLQASFNLRRDAAPLATLTSWRIGPSTISFNLRRDAAPLATGLRSCKKRHPEIVSISGEMPLLWRQKRCSSSQVKSAFQSQARCRSSGDLCKYSNQYVAILFQSQARCRSSGDVIMLKF